MFSLFLMSYMVLNKGMICGFLAYASAVLIDFDHYAWYVIKKKDFSLRNAVNFFLSKHKPVLLLFHTIWFQIAWLIFVFMMKFINSALYFLGSCVAVGMLFHLFLDFLYYVLAYYDLPGSGILGKSYSNKKEIIKDAKAKFLGVL